MPRKFAEQLRGFRQARGLTQQELADAIAPHLTPDCQGRIDHIDMDAWRLTRYLITGTQMKKSSAGLNHVLAYSGH